MWVFAPQRSLVVAVMNVLLHLQGLQNVLDAGDGHAFFQVVAFVIVIYDRSRSGGMAVVHGIVMSARVG